MLGKLLVLKKFFGSGGDKKKKRIVYQNYGTFRNPDEYYFLPYSGKAKIILDLVKTLTPRIPPSGSTSNTNNQ